MENTGTSRRRFLRLAAALPALGTAQTQRAHLQLAIAESLFINVSRNEAMAATSVGLNRLASDLDVPVEFSGETLSSVDEIRASLNAGEAQAVVVDALQFRQVYSLLDQQSLVVPDMSEGQRYAILTKRVAPPKTLEDLRGTRLMVHRSAKLCLAGPWLHLLTKAGTNSAQGHYFSEVRYAHRPQAVVLPVFFDKADAALVTSEALEPLYSLNPKLSEQLLEVSTSPPILPYLLAFSLRCPEASKRLLLDNLHRAVDYEAGKQVMRLFQVSRLVKRDISAMKTTLKLIDDAERAGWNPGSSQIEVHSP
jgi:hypothetical protein